MRALHILDEHGLHMLDGVYETAAQAGQFGEDTFELLREEGAHLYRLASRERCVKYTADEAGACLNSLK